ncbi:hypothetical protein AB4028_15915 [Janibacter sp. RAF20_2_2]|uniref:hypothetical protein n=1 Tax=unclassified Janibacter TaxID=2649294 RepID=UPI003F8E964D
MSPMMERHSHIGDIEVKPGARIPYGLSLELRFSVTVYCHGVDPQRWLGELRLGSRVIARTELMNSYEQAGRAAELMLEDKFAELFGITN